ncbi:MAG: ATP-binding protein [Deltaproteobacteria bacterium]|nr:ATP-binding protein [Deltaproteobacteria bacterium]
MTHFVGRKEEMEGLRALMEKRSASLAVIKGRRRIGKSRLGEEFSRFFQQAFFFSGLPPTKGIMAQHQRDEFQRKMHHYRIPSLGSQDWGDLFEAVAQKCHAGRILVVFDEISWMGMKDPTFLGKLKTVWDNDFKKNQKLILILSGSQSTWIEKNILSSSGFVGRISYILTLEELSLPECNQFWFKQKLLVSAYEKLKILNITGGVPRYLEEIQPQKTAEENIKHLCFRPEGFLFNEFEQIFSDLFSKRSDKYKKIVGLLCEKKASIEVIAKVLGRKKGGDISHCLDDLCKTGFITRDYTWDIKTASPSKLSRYRLSDNYVRFYLKYIEPAKKKILRGAAGELPSSWLSIMGLQFENLVLGRKNRPLLFKRLGIASHEVLWSDPYFQTKAGAREGCQIDFLIQTKFNTLYLCEIKFHGRPVQKEVVRQVEDKIRRLQIPRGFSVRPVLIHVNGVDDSVLESDFFSNIIDFSTLLSAY